MAEEGRAADRDGRPVSEEERRPQEARGRQRGVRDSRPSPGRRLRRRPDEPAEIAVGKLVGTHGVRGELKLLPFNRDSEALAPGMTVRLAGPGGATPVRVLSARPHKAVLLVRLEGVSTMEAAERLVGAAVAVPTAELPALPAGEFYWFEVVGLEAVTESGERLGRVADILANPGHDVYVLEHDGGERLVPAVDAVVIAIEPEAGRMVVRPPEGLFEL